MPHDLCAPVHAVPALLHQLPDLGRGSRVRRFKDPPGRFWHVVDVRPKKQTMHQILEGQGQPDPAQQAEASADGGGRESAAEEARDKQTGVPGEYVAKNGFVIKNREFSAKVYGVEFRQGAPVSGRVRALRKTYQRIWEVHAQ